MMLPMVFIEQRFNVCQNCDELKQSWLRYYCNICKCTVNSRRNLLNKLVYSGQECPLGKWSKVNEYR